MKQDFFSYLYGKATMKEQNTIVMKKTGLLLCAFVLLFSGCKQKVPRHENNGGPADCIEMLGDFKFIEIPVDTAILSVPEKRMIPVFNQITDIIDQLFCYQSYGRSENWQGVEDTCLRQMIAINFGPWNRFRNNMPLVDSVGEKPAGANFYPADMTREEFQKWNDSTKSSPYSYIRRNADGKLVSIPYSVENKKCIQKISALFEKAADLTDDKNFKDYLLKRALAFLSDQYFQSEKAWLKTETNQIDFIAGPLEIYDDKLFGYKTEFESFLLIKDSVLTKKYSRYALMLPFLQKALPVPIEYRHEDPEMISGLSVCNILRYGGGARAGAYTISVTYPSAFQESGHKNQKNIQFKNALDSKYDHIFFPLANLVLEEEQAQIINKETFFQNNIFFELGLRLGIKNILKTGKPVRNILKEHTTILQIVNAYAMSMYIAEKLSSVNEIENLNSNYTVFLADIFRVARFESSSPYAKSKIILYNYLAREKAVKRNASGKYAVDYGRMKNTMDKLIGQIIKIQGDGNYEAANIFLEEFLVIDESFRNDLNKIAEILPFKDIVIK